REPADLGMQLAVREPAGVARLSFEEDRGLLAALREMHVQTVERNIEASVGEPAIVRRRGIIESHGEGRMPGDLLAREPRPEAAGVVGRLLAQALEVRPLDARPGGEIRGRRERSLLQQDGHYVLVRHDAFPSQTQRRKTSIAHWPSLAAGHPVRPVRRRLTL